MRVEARTILCSLGRARRKTTEFELGSVVLINKKYYKTLLSVLVACGAANINAATYKVTELERFDEYRQHFAIDINEQGDVLGVARGSYNFPFYFEDYLINDDGYFKTYCGISEEEVTSQVLDSSSTSCVKTELGRSSNSSGRPLFRSSPYHQKVGDSRTFLMSGGASNLINLTDEVDAELGEYTRSTIEQLNAINDNGLAVGTGSAPYLPLVFQQSGEDAAEDPVKFWVREFKNRAVIYVNGGVSFIEPEESAYGGVSGATDVSNNGYVSGYESIEVYTSKQETIDECDTDLYPVEVCAWSAALSSSNYVVRPVVWQIDESGNVISKVSYPLSFTPSDTQTGNYSAYASAINDNGIAAGYGSSPHSEYSGIYSLPVYYKESETIPILKDQKDYDQGFAADINNNNIIVGTLQQYYDREYHNKFFIYDIDADQLLTPETFYASAESVANAINDNGIVIGEAEFEPTTSSVRRKHGFIYDMSTKELLDVNDLTECGSAYEIVEMKSINNSDVIIATALKTVEAKDQMGEVVLDDDGNPETEEVAVVVKVEPIANGQIEDCSAIEEPPYERRGFSFGYWLIALTGSLIALRRRYL
jgi:uncharacterized membrane protein